MSAPTETKKADSPGESLARSAFEHYGEQLHRFLMRRLSRSQDATDLMQEVFLRLLRIKRGELIRNPQAYLYGIASRVIRDYQVQARGEHVVFNSELVGQRTEHPNYLEPDGLAEGVGLVRQLEHALGLLTHAQRQIFLLERYEGLTQLEIAAKLGLSPHTVKKYAVQALAIVRLNCRPIDERCKERRP